MNFFYCVLFFCYIVLCAFVTHISLKNLLLLLHAAM